MIFKGFITIIISIFLVVVIYATGESGIRHFYPSTPVPSPRPMDRSSDVVKKFRESGLEAREMNAGYLMEPAHLKEATVFLIPSYGGNVGGYISTYDSDANLRIFEKDNILLLISGKVPHEIAGKYEHVLNNMSVE
jgi:hypothetical protein